MLFWRVNHTAYPIGARPIQAHSLYTGTKEEPIELDVPSSTSGNVTKALRDWRGGDEEALARLTNEVYKELRRLAGGILAGHAPNRTIQPTVLVHELYFQLPDVQTMTGKARRTF